MTATFVGEVERLTGRTVVAYHSQVVLEPPSCFEIFVLDPTQGGWAAEQAAAPVEAADLQEPGQVGDVDQLPSPGEKAAPGARAEPAPRSPGARPCAPRSPTPSCAWSPSSTEGRRAHADLHRRRARLLRLEGS